MYDWAELRHFRYLLTILERQGFRVAAEELHTSQPNLSVQARQFQENASVRLYKKLKNGRIRPTETGLAFITLAKLLLETRDEVINALIAIERGEIGSVRFGCAPLVDQSLFRSFCAMHKELLPTCSIRPMHGDTAQLAEEVLTGVVDAAIVTLPLKHPDLRIEEIRRDRLVVCLRRDDALASKPALQATDLQDNLAVLYHPQRHPDAHERLLELLGDAGVRVAEYSRASHRHGLTLIREGTTLIVWLRKAKSPVRVSLEATGIYSLDLAFALDAAEGIEVAVLNPKVANRFAQTIRRSKTDAADAEVLVEYTHRMRFTPWIAPSASSMRLRTIVRHVETLSVQSAQNQNRLHAAHGTSYTPGCVIQDLKRSVASLELRIRRLRREAMTLVREDDLLRKRYELLISIPGIAQVSAMQLLAELSTLPSDLTVREWVAHSGLDPAHEISGSSVRKASRISRAGNRHLRRALYMPALVASRCDPYAKAFFESLLAETRPVYKHSLLLRGSCSTPSTGYFEAA